MIREYDVYDKLHTWMLSYQAKNGEPPTLREVAEALSSMNYRSSARHTLHSLIMRGMIAIVKPEGHARRYEAVLPQKAAA